VSDKTGQEGRKQRLGGRVGAVGSLAQGLGPAKENIYALESPKGYSVGLSGAKTEIPAKRV